MDRGQVLIDQEFASPDTSHSVGASFGGFLFRIDSSVAVDLPGLRDSSPGLAFSDSIASMAPFGETINVVAS
jgi:hypothetical protein